MAVTNGWGQGAKNNTNGWGKLATNNIGAGSIYEDSYSGDTALIGVSADFSYSAASFAQDDTNPTPTITGTTGGTFSGTSGLVFVSTSTGEINLSASTVAAHIITYTVSGVSSTFNLSITAAAFSNVYSFEFDGVDEYINADLDGTSTGGVLAAADSDLEVGVSLWFKLNASGNNLGIYQWGDVLTDGTPFILLQQKKFGTTGYRVRFLAAGGQSSAQDINVNQWYNVIITRSAADNTWRGYLDGVEFYTRNDGGSFTNRASAIGIYLGNGYLGYADCNIDEFAVWNTHLNTSAVAEIAASPKDLDSLTNVTSPVAWYRMGEEATFTSGNWTLTNQGTGSNNATSYNMEEADRKTDTP